MSNSETRQWKKPERSRFTLPTRTAQLYEQFAKSDALEATIKKNLEVLGYGE